MWFTTMQNEHSLIYVLDDQTDATEINKSSELLFAISCYSVDDMGGFPAKRNMCIDTWALAHSIDSIKAGNTKEYSIPNLCQTSL